MIYLETKELIVSAKHYTEEFKKEAIKQIKELGVPVLQVSKSLGVSDVTLFKRLRAENKKLKEERDILKKAAAYFANESQ